jgi:hypothetical protein
VLQCSLCSLAPPPAKASGSRQNTSDNAGTANYAGISEWAQLDLQSIQHRDYFGHLSKLFQTCQNLIFKINFLCQLISFSVKIVH